MFIAWRFVRDLSVVVTMLCPVVPTSDQDAELAARLAARFNLTLGSTHDMDQKKCGGWFIRVADGRVDLIELGNDKVVINDEPPKLYRVSRRDLLGRAVGGSRTGNHSVIDCTAGLGTDAIQLAMMGFTIQCLERSPVVALLLSARIQQLTEELQQRISLQHGDAIQQLSQMEAADVVYLDPMYPLKPNATALPPLQIQVLRSLVGKDLDEEQLFQTACRHARQRVVVKRPLHAPPLAPQPAGQHCGKLVRYDIYPTATL